MTEHQLSKANRLKDERDDIQDLIDFLAEDHHNRDRFGVKIEVKCNFLKILSFVRQVAQKEFSYTTKEVIINALVKQRDNLTKQIEEL